jgi:MFS family permease
VIRATYRGRAVGTVQAGWAVGWASAAGFYSLFFSLLAPDQAWRALFFVGILPALLLLYIRKRVSEPALYNKSRGIPQHAATPRSLAIFGPALLRTTLMASFVAIGAQGGYYAVTSWLPLYLKTYRGLSVLNTTGYLLVVIAGSFTGYLVSGHLTDRIGRRATLAIFAVCSLISVWLYTTVEVGNVLVLALGFPLGFFPSGSFAPMGSFFTELFPTVVRGSGQGFSYNVGRFFGAIFPTLVGYLSARFTLGPAIAIFAMAAYGLMAASVFLLPETRGKELDSA